MRQRKTSREDGALAGTALDGDLSAMGADDRLGDGEPETCPASGAGAGAVRAIEALEDVGQVLGTDPFAGVADPKAGLLGKTAVDLNSDFAAVGGVPQR